MQKRSVKRITITYINGKSYTVKDVENFTVKTSSVTFNKKTKSVVDEGITIYSEDFHIIGLKNVVSILDESNLTRIRSYEIHDSEVDTVNTTYL